MGIISRHEKNVNFNDLQSVDVVSGPLLLMFGLRKVKGYTSSPEQIVVVSPGRHRDRNTLTTPDVDLILGKNIAQEFLELTRREDVQKVEVIAQK